jgi:hypothetical protein
MNSVEDQVRAATRAEASTLREVRPLRLTPASTPGAAPARRAGAWARRSKTWLAPVTAAAVVIALAVSLVIIRDIPGERTVTPTASSATSASTSASVPKYYVWLPGAGDLALPPGSTEAVVSDTFTGKRLATLRPKAGYLFFSVMATADDRTFILGEGQHAQPAVWYVLRIKTGSAMRTSMSKLPIPALLPDSLTVAPAISPDGRKLAVLYIHSSTRSGETMRIYSTATGAVLHTWSSPGQLGDYGQTTLSWTADEHQLTIGSEVSMWMLNVTRSGHSLTADSKLAWSVKSVSTIDTDQPSPFSCATDLTALATPDGKSVVCAAFGVLRAISPPGSTGCPAIPPWNTTGFLEYSTTTGKLARTLYKSNSSCAFAGDDALWTNASGSMVIGYVRLGTVTRFGVFSAHTFTPLPEPLTTKTWGTPGIAW